MTIIIKSNEANMYNPYAASKTKWTINKSDPHPLQMGIPCSQPIRHVRPATITLAKTTENINNK